MQSGDLVKCCDHSGRLKETSKGHWWHWATEEGLQVPKHASARKKSKKGTTEQKERNCRTEKNKNKEKSLDNEWTAWAELNRNIQRTGRVNTITQSKANILTIIQILTVSLYPVGAVKRINRLRNSIIDLDVLWCVKNFPLNTLNSNYTIHQYCALW